MRALSALEHDQPVLGVEHSPREDSVLAGGRVSSNCAVGTALAQQGLCLSWWQSMHNLCQGQCVGQVRALSAVEHSQSVPGLGHLVQVICLGGGVTHTQLWFCVGIRDGLGSGVAMACTHSMCT